MRRPILVLFIVLLVGTSGFQFTRAYQIYNEKRFLASDFQNTDLIRYRYRAKDRSSSGKFYLRYAQILTQKSYLTRDSAEQRALRCESLTMMTKAKERRPRSAKIHVRWALQAEEGRRYQCAGTLSPKEAEEEMRLALTKAPNDASLYFPYALLLYRTDQRDKAFARLRSFIEYARRYEGYQIDTIVDLFGQDKQALGKLLPRSILRISNWLRYTRKRRPDIYKEKQAEIGMIVLESLENLEIDNKNTSNLLRALLQIRRDLRSTVANQKIDSILAENFFQRDQETSHYLERRSKLHSVSFLSGLRRHDSRPEKSSLLSWGSNSHINLRQKNTSFGFALPDHNREISVELRTTPERGSNKIEKVQFFYSLDNASWKMLRSPPTPQQATIEGEYYLRYDLPDTKARYWKIQVLPVSTDLPPGNRLSDLITVYVS